MRLRAVSNQVDTTSVIAPLDRAIQYPLWLLDRLVKPGDDSTVGIKLA